MIITKDKINAARQVLIDNGIKENKVDDVLEALGYALLDQNIFIHGYKAKNIQWDKTDDNGFPVAVDLPSEVVATLEDLGLPENATDDEAKEAMYQYLVDYTGYNHTGFFFEPADYRMEFDD